MRAEFFGAGGDTEWNRARLESRYPEYRHHRLDVRDRSGVEDCIATIRPDLVVHAAAQPSHDLAASRPLDDFDINAVGTLNLLESVRRHAPRAVFVHLSTNKVYGDGPNHVPLKELPTRWDYDDASYTNGIDESFPLDQWTHSIFGASKLAADVMVQEYGRYYGMRTCCLRAGCITGGSHSGVELHGFLSYLVRCHMAGELYRVYGYGGKQVRDNIHARDLAAFALGFFERPRIGEVYNVGGGRRNSCSILEAFALLEDFTGRPTAHEFVDTPRVGDHICYISDLRKAESHYGWSVTADLHSIITELGHSWRERLPDVDRAAS
jgi:CDP-paratose 2-epimerase